jgi:Mg2+ and Co2+ transporter CorA
MSFGWSAGDIVSAIKLITEIVNALDEAQGVVDEYRSTTYFLTSLTRTIAVFSELETNQLPDALKTELSSQLYHIKIHIEAFLSEISQYRKLINPLQYKNKLSNVRSKLSWHFKVEERVRKLQNAICKNLQILEILLQRAIL